MSETAPNIPTARVHEWFSLTYANFLVVPRSLLQSMPDEWQHRFVSCLEEMRDHFAGLPEGFNPPGYRVNAVDRQGRLVSLRGYRCPHYNRGRTHVAPDGTVTGGPW